jgi:hypothetical protein
MDSKISIFYAPHLPSGPESVGGQHIHHFNMIGRNEHPPPRAFWIDLSRQVRSWRSAGEGVILMGDAHINLRTPPAISYLTSMGL